MWLPYTIFINSLQLCIYRDMTLYYKIIPHFFLRTVTGSENTQFDTYSSHSQSMWIVVEQSRTGLVAWNTPYQYERTRVQKAGLAFRNKPTRAELGFLYSQLL